MTSAQSQHSQVTETLDQLPALKSLRQRKIRIKRVCQVPCLRRWSVIMLKIPATVGDDSDVPITATAEISG